MNNGVCYGQGMYDDGSAPGLGLGAHAGIGAAEAAQKGFRGDLGQHIGASQDSRDADSFDVYRKQRSGFYHIVLSANRAAHGGPQGP